MNKEQKFRILGLANKIKNSAFTPEQIDNQSRDLVRHILDFLVDRRYIQYLDTKKDLDDLLDEFEDLPNY